MREEPSFAFEKKLGISECVYGNIPSILNMIGKLLYCLKETNKIHGTECEFFRLDFRQLDFDEQMQFPHGAFLLDLKWGSRKELESLSYCIVCKNEKVACVCMDSDRCDHGSM